MKKLGITGGIGSGKSEVLNYIRDNYDARIIYTDLVAKDLHKRDGECFDEIADIIGRDAIGNDGEIIHAEMAKRIYKNPDLLTRVNKVLHPAVKRYVLDEMKIEEENGREFFFVEAALLIEDHYDEILDKLIYVYASKETRRERLKKSRGYSDEKIDDIFSKQLSDDEYLAGTDYIIDNDADIAAMQKNVDEIIIKIRDL